MKHGSPTVFTADPHNWVVNHADYLYAYAVRRLNDEELCRDLVQETFLAALERLSEFRGESPERTWLTAILKYKLIAVYRKRGTRSGEEPVYFDPHTGHWTEEAAPRHFRTGAGDPLMQKELSAILQLCMQKLPRLWFCIFSMKHVDEMKSDVICKELQLTPNNYWVILHRAKVNLRACIQQQYV